MGGESIVMNIISHPLWSGLLGKSGLRGKLDFKYS